jgi:hypothetical protein
VRFEVAGLGSVHRRSVADLGEVGLVQPGRGPLRARAAISAGP